MIQHAAIAPFLLPALTACLLLALDGRLRWQRVVSVASALVQCAVVFRLAMAVRDGDVLVYALGDWPVHLGIVFVLDRLAALMLCMAAPVPLPRTLRPGASEFNVANDWATIDGWYRSIGVMTLVPSATRLVACVIAPSHGITAGE